MNPQNPWPQPTPPQAQPSAPAPVDQNGWQQPAPAPQPTAPAEAPSTLPPGQFPVDYLNQIAAPTQVRKMSPVLLFSLMGAGLLLLGGLLFMIIQSTAPPDVSVQLANVKQRFVTLSAVTTEQGKKITQSELSSINSTLGTLLTSMDSGVTEYMKAHSAKTAATSTTQSTTEKAYRDKLSQKLNDAYLTGTQSTTEKAYRDKLSQKLNDAYLTGTLDRIYASEMTYQLGILKSKLQSIKAAANNKTFNELYATNIKSLDTVSSTLSKFQSTK